MKGYKAMRKLYNKKIGDPSSEYGMPDGDERFIKNVAERAERHEQLWQDFVSFMLAHDVRPDELRTMFTRYYDEFIK